MPPEVSDRSFLETPCELSFTGRSRGELQTYPAPSISAFFPCYNDAPTIGTMVRTVADALRSLTDDFEVIVVNDGSEDASAQVLSELRRECGYLRVVTHDANRGYGGALRSGFAAATKDLVFYTDGDAQYDPAEMVSLLAQLTPDVDVVQGWKMERGDAWYRKLAGWAYCQFVRCAFGLDTRDVDCDFRLIRRRVLDSCPLRMTSGCITVELVSRIEGGGFRMREVPVHHYPRPYGSSQFFSLGRISRTFWQLASLWLELHVAGPAGAPGVVAAAPTTSQVTL